ncbi:unnamed protein product, partial [Discosporangium mesarthrocarpum]
MQDEVDRGSTDPTSSVNPKSVDEVGVVGRCFDTDGLPFTTSLAPGQQIGQGEDVFVDSITLHGGREGHGRQSWGKRSPTHTHSRSWGRVSLGGTTPGRRRDRDRDCRGFHGRSPPRRASLTGLEPHLFDTDDGVGSGNRHPVQYLHEARPRVRSEDMRHAEIYDGRGTGERSGTLRGTCDMRGAGRRVGQRKREGLRVDNGWRDTGVSCGADGEACEGGNACQGGDTHGERNGAGLQDLVIDSEANPMRRQSFSSGRRRHQSWVPTGSSLSPPAMMNGPFSQGYTKVRGYTKARSPRRSLSSGSLSILTPNSVPRSVREGILEEGFGVGHLPPLGGDDEQCA